MPPEQLLVTAEALVPPAGYEADSVVAATYSLDLPSALSIPLALIRHGEFAGRSINKLQKWPLLEALDRFRDRCRVFCDAGAFYPPKSRQRLLTLLQDIVVPVALINSTAPQRIRSRFHPKFVLVSFVSPRKEPRLRLVCMSRNLTASTAFDVGVVLEGERHPSGRKAQGNDEFADFLESLPHQAIQTHQVKDAATVVKALADQVRLTTWTPPSGFEEVVLHPNGPTTEPRRGGRRRDNSADPARPTDDEDRLLILSAFLGAPRLHRLLEPLERDGKPRKRPVSVLISSGHELESIGRAALGEFDQRFEFFADVDDSTRTESEESEPSSNGEPRTDSPRVDAVANSGLHAKLFVAEGSRRTRWILGSGNATSAGVGGNVELMVELRGTTRRWGLDRLIGEQGIGEFLNPVGEDIADQESPESPTVSRSEQILDEITARQIECRAERSEDDRYDVAIAIDGPAMSLAEGTVTFRLPRLGSPAVTFDPDDEPGAVLRAVQFADLPQFLVCRTTAEGYSHERLVPVSLVGVNADEVREAARAMEIGEDNPLDYIRFFLSGAQEELDPVLYVGDEGELEDDGNDPPGRSGAPEGGDIETGPILEQLLNLARDDLRGDGASRLSELMQVVRAYQDRLPDGLVDLCAQVDVAFNSARHLTRSQRN